MTVDQRNGDELLLEGDRLRDSGDLNDALAIYEHVSQMEAHSAVGFFKLGTTYSRMNRDDDAVAAYQQAILLRQDYPEPINNLALIHTARGEFEQAELLYRGLLADWPDNYEAHINIGNLLMDTGRAGEAQYYFRRAVSMRPDVALPHGRLGSALSSRGRIRDAVAEFKKAIELDAACYPAWNGLGACYFDEGAHATADRAFETSLRLNSYATAWHNWLFLANFMSLPREQVFQRHKQYGEHVRALCGPVRRFENLSFSPVRRLRVGIVSGDFRRHSVAYFLQSAISTLDRGGFELWAYSTYRADDEMTERLRPNFVQWRDLVGLADKAAAELIREDQVDVLIDLAGHTNRNRLMIFGYKPAPIQVSWLGYPNTTGLDCMDYRITDSLVDPDSEDAHYYTEKLVRLPGPFLCYTPPTTAPAIVDSPCSRNGHITFGSFNARVKLGAECIALWSGVLKAVPDSRLVIKSYSGIEGDAGDDLMRLFEAEGIEAERVTLLSAKDSTEDHLATYGEVDIALDAFPYNGTTTSCEALWMGVPVLSLAGNRHASRVGLDILSRVGLADLVAHGTDEFIRLAIELSLNHARLRQLRSGMRQRMRDSTLMDAAAMGRHLGSAIREMWLAFCATAEGQSDMAAGQACPEALLPASTRLNVGGWQTKSGWKLLNAQDGPGVDFVADIRHLDRFPDGCCLEIYASHVLEHVGQREIIPTLQGFHRLLIPGGKLYLSVPDLQTLSWLLNRPHIEPGASFRIMRMMFGAQADDADFHFIGLTFELMMGYLQSAGFASVEQVRSFGLFDDTSGLLFESVPISLNLLVEK